MARIDGNTLAFSGNGVAATRTGALPPPSVAGMRTVARLRGAFDESLPTLRLPRIPLRQLAALEPVEPVRKPKRRSKRRLVARPRVALPSDGVPVAIAPETTAELSSRDLQEIDDDGDEGVDDGGADVISIVSLLREESRVRTMPLEDPGVPLVQWWADHTEVHHRVGATEPLEVPVVGVERTTAVRPVAVPPPRPWSSALAGALAVLVLVIGWHVVTPGLSPVATTFTGNFAGLAQLCPPVIAPVPVAPPQLVPVTPAPVAAMAPPLAAVAPAVATMPAAAPMVASAPVVSEVAVAVREPTPRHRRVARRRHHEPDEEAIVEAATPSPAPVVVPIPTARGNDATALLREAERAFAQGRYASALYYADRSRASAADPRAARIAALAACHLGKPKQAAAALLALPVGQRTSVRNTCSARGLQLG